MPRMEAEQNEGVVVGMQQQLAEQDFDDSSLANLFTNEEYEVKTFHFGSKELQLRCLQAASTDYDLTGQILWPAAQLLATFLAANTGIMTNTHAACELGSGLGLTGLLCGQYCDIVLADHNEIVLRVLQENIQANPSQHKVRCRLVDWEVMEDVMALKDMSPGHEGYDLVLGADICYSIKALPFIFQSIKTLLKKGTDSRGLLGYVSRAKAIDRGIHIESEKAGLDLCEVEGTRQSVGAGLEGAVYSLRHC